MAVARMYEAVEGEGGEGGVVMAGCGFLCVGLERGTRKLRRIDLIGLGFLGVILAGTRT